MLQPRVTPPQADLLRTLPLLFLGAPDAAGRLWASALVGQPGFVSAQADPSLVRITGARPLGAGEQRHRLCVWDNPPQWAHFLVCCGASAIAAGRMGRSRVYTEGCRLPPVCPCPPAAVPSGHGSHCSHSPIPHRGARPPPRPAGGLPGPAVPQPAVNNSTAPTPPYPAGAPDLSPGQQVGCLGLLFRSRRRVRVNGEVLEVQRSEGGQLDVLLRVDQAYGNCPKYIQASIYCVLALWPL